MLAIAALVLQALFVDPAMFDDAEAWQEAGFEVDGKGKRSDIMVASHASAPGYLFKKYSKKVSLKDQLENYRRRIEGADKLREFITAQQLTKIVVPQKYLHELPPAFARKDVPAYVLIVDRLSLLGSSASKQRYSEIDPETLRQLCLVLRTFQGLDSGARNVPFTTDGQIAFIDTERWSQTKKVHLSHIRKYLSDEQRAFADGLFK